MWRQGARGKEVCGCQNLRSEHIVPTSLIAQHNTRHKRCRSLRSDHVVPASLIAQHNPAGRPHTRLPPTAVKRNLSEKTATCSEQAPILSASQKQSLHNHHKCILLHLYRKVILMCSRIPLGLPPTMLRLAQRKLGSCNKQPLYHISIASPLSI